MGFSSWLCSKTKTSIPAYPAAEYPIEESDVILVLPDNSTVQGIYDGYGCIDGQRVLEDLLQPFYADIVGHEYDSSLKYIYFTGADTIRGEPLFVVRQFFWDQPVKALGGKTLNQMVAAGHSVVSDFDRINGLVKLVKAYAYSGEKFEELPVAEFCPDQGYFYESPASVNPNLV